MGMVLGSESGDRLDLSHIVRLVIGVEVVVGRTIVQDPTLILILVLVTLMGQVLLRH